MAFGHLEGPSGPLDSCKKKWTPIFLWEAPTNTTPAAAPLTPCTELLFFTTTPIFVEIEDVHVNAYLR